MLVDVEANVGLVGIYSGLRTPALELGEVLGEAVEGAVEESIGELHDVSLVDAGDLLLHSRCPLLSPQCLLFEQSSHMSPVYWTLWPHMQTLQAHMCCPPSEGDWQW